MVFQFEEHEETFHGGNVFNSDKRDGLAEVGMRIQSPNHRLLSLAVPRDPRGPSELLVSGRWLGQVCRTVTLKASPVAWRRDGGSQAGVRGMEVEQSG